MDDHADTLILISNLSLLGDLRVPRVIIFERETKRFWKKGRTKINFPTMLIIFQKATLHLLDKIEPSKGVSFRKIGILAYCIIK